MNTRVERLQETARRLLSLVVAPAAVSLTAIITTNLSAKQLNQWWLWTAESLAVAASIVLYSIGYKYWLEGMLSRIAQRLRARRFNKPRLLILNGTLDSEQHQTPPNPVQSDRTIADWLHALDHERWTLTIGPSKEFFRQPVPDIVINPFGEVYPEGDFTANTSARKIRDYVWQGGVYVNVAGIPFWYRYDPRTGHQETAGRLEGIFEDRAKWSTLFHDLFPNLTPKNEPETVDAIQTDDEKKRFGEISTAGGTSQIVMFRSYPLQSAQLVPMLRDKHNQHCIIGAYLYGAGCFIFAGVKNVNHDPTFRKVVASVQAWAQYEARSRKP